MNTSLHTPIIWDAAGSSIHSVQNEQEYFKRPIKRGNPSHANWNRMAEIIKYNIESISPNADFNEISSTIEDWARFHDIILPRWAVDKFANKILDLYCCQNYLCQLKTSEYAALHDSLAIAENKALLQSFNLNQFRELTYKQQIGFLLSNVSLLKEVLEIINNQNK